MYEALKAEIVRIKFARKMTYAQIAAELGAYKEHTVKRFMCPGAHKYGESENLAAALSLWVKRNS